MAKDIIKSCPCCNSTELQQLKNGIFRCKSCGAEINFSKFDTDDIVRRLNEITELRQRLDFETSKDRLDDFISEHKDCADAYFYRILAENGVVYVDDYDGISKVPTISRASPKSILVTSDYKNMLQYAFKDEKNFFISEIDRIDKIREEIINKANKEEPFDIFICYKRTVDESSYTKDSIIARKIHDYLSKLGYKVFFAEESILDGEYEPFIYNALMTSTIMLVVAGSSPEFVNAPWVKNEWQRFLKLVEDDDTKKKTIVPVCANGFDPYDLPNRLKKYQALNYDAEFNERLSRIIKEKLSVNLKSRLDKKQVEVVEVKPKQVEEVVIEKRSFGSTQTIINLATSDKTKLEDAKTNLQRKRFSYAESYAQQVLANNKTHAEAAWICFLVDHKVSNEDELLSLNIFRFSKNYEKTLEYARIALENDSHNYDYRLGIIESFILKQIEFGNINKALYNFFMEYIAQDRELEFAQELNRKFLNHLRNVKKLNIKFINFIQEDLIYSALTKGGADGLILHYNNIAKTLLELNRFNDAEYYYNKTLKLFEYNPDALWGVYKCHKKLATTNSLQICKAIDNPKEVADVVTKIIKGGYRIRLTRSNYVYATLMYSYDLVKLGKVKKGIELFDEIYKVIPESFSMKNDLIKFADYLLLHGHFKYADKYYQEVQSDKYDKYDFEANLGRFKVHLKVRTNYGLLAIKKPFDTYREYYDTLREIDSINEEKGQEKLFTKLLSIHSGFIDCKNSKEKNDKRTQFIYLEKEDILNDEVTKIPDLKFKSDILKEYKAKKSRIKRERENAESVKTHFAWYIVQGALILLGFINVLCLSVLGDEAYAIVGVVIAVIAGIIGSVSGGISGAIGGALGGYVVGMGIGWVMGSLSSLITSWLMSLMVTIDGYVTLSWILCYGVLVLGFIITLISGIFKKKKITIKWIIVSLIVIGICVAIGYGLTELIYNNIDGFIFMD